MVNIGGDRQSETGKTPLFIGGRVCINGAGIYHASPLGLANFPAKQVFNTPIGEDQYINLDDSDLTSLETFIDMKIQPTVLVQHTLENQSDKFTLVISNEKGKVVYKLSIYLSIDRFAPMAMPPRNSAWNVLKKSWPIVGFGGSSHGVKFWADTHFSRRLCQITNGFILAAPVE